MDPLSWHTKYASYIVLYVNPVKLTPAATPAVETAKFPVLSGVTPVPPLPSLTYVEFSGAVVPCV